MMNWQKWKQSAIEYRWYIVTAVIAVLLTACLMMVGCSMASVTEYYERTPTHAVSVGEGGVDVVTTQPFRIEEAEDE